MVYKKHCKGYLNEKYSDFYFLNDGSVYIWTIEDYKETLVSADEYADLLYNGWVRLVDELVDTN